MGWIWKNIPSRDSASPGPLVPENILNFVYLFSMKAWKFDRGREMVRMMKRSSAGRRGGNVVCGTNDNAEREKTRHNRFEETRGRVVDYLHS